MEANKAWQGALNGMEASKDHANAETPGWSSLALDFFVVFANNCGREFLTEEVVERAALNSELVAPDTRAWGSIAMRAKRLGFIENAGMTYSTGKGKGNPAPRTLWRAKIIKK